MLHIDGIGDRIAITGDTYPIKDVLKVIPGRWWDADSKSWTFPRTLESYRLLTHMFPFADVRPTLVDLAEQEKALSVALAAKREVDLPIPDHMRTRPWLHQLQAYHFALNRMRAKGGAMLALDMGTGKSKVAIDLITALKCRRVLITCPVSVMDVWPEEFSVHGAAAGVLVCSRKHSVESRQKYAMAWLRDRGQEGVIVINHEAVWRQPFRDFVLKEWFDMIIVDESHRAKSPGGKLSRFLGGIPKNKPETFRLALTGTPCPHSIDDMFAQARFIDPSVWGCNHQIYKSQYIITGGFGGYQTLGFKNTEDWNDKFHNLAIQVKSDDVLDLPEVVHTNRYCELDGAEKSVYEDMKTNFIAEVKGGTITASNALVKLLRLAQIVQGSVRNTMGTDTEVGTSKMGLLFDVLEDIREPAVVFCRFKCDLRIVREVCAKYGRPSFELSGESKQLEEWKQSCRDGMPAVIAVQIQAGGVGISMVQARYCIYLSKDFNLGSYEQSLARVHRPGQQEHVTYIHLIAKGTIDETINKALAKRKDVIEAILEELG
jgi:SNF2 family DNA or RNA helicase